MKKKLSLVLSGCILITPVFGCNPSQQRTDTTSEITDSQSGEDASSQVSEYSSEISSFDPLAVTEISESTFPLESCSDDFPTDPNAYPVEYIVYYTEYTPEKLELIQSQLCQDGFKTIKEDTNEEIIQVASLVSGDLGGYLDYINYINKYEDMYINYEYRVMESKPNNLPDNTSQDNQTIAKSAGLSSQQLENLESLPTAIVDWASGVKVKVVLPTYIPERFNADVEIIEDQGTYIVKYRNDQNLCFSITGFPQPPIGDEPSFKEIVRVYSPAFGTVDLENSYSDYLGGQDVIGFAPGAGFEQGISVGKSVRYNFESPTFIFSSEDCKTISLKEAVKIVQSLRYLNY